MKKRWFVLFVICITAILFSSCSGESLVGKWAFGANTWQFNDDGTFFANINTLNYTGTYTTDAGKLHIETDFFGLSKSLDYDYVIKGDRLALTGDVTLTGAGSMTLEYERLSSKSESSESRKSDVTTTPTRPGITQETSPVQEAAMIPVESLFLSETELTLQEGETYTLHVGFAPSNATEKEVAWTSSALGVATASNGVVKAVSPGTATVIAASGNGKIAMCNVKVIAKNGQEELPPETVSPISSQETKPVETQPPTPGRETKPIETQPPAPRPEETQPIETSAPRVEVSSVALNESNITLTIGESVTLACAVLPENAADSAVFWSSSNSSVAAVVNGIVTARAQGNASIFAKTKNGMTAECRITVIDISDFEFQRVENGGGYKVTKYYGSAASVNIPSSYNGRAVTGIGGFRGTGVTSVIIPEGVTSIEAGTFLDCTKLKNVTIPNTVTSIEAGAFRGCTALQSITIPDGVSSIGEVAFLGCTALQSITIPNTVTSIEDGTFQGCTALQSITIPDGVTSVGYDAFKSCNNLFYSIYDDAKYLGNNGNPYMVLIKADTATKSVHPKTRLIAGEAFYRCTALQNITIPRGVTSIGRSAFSFCTALQSITIPNSVTSVEKMAFSSCYNLERIDFDASKETWGVIYQDYNISSYQTDYANLVTVYCSNGTSQASKGGK